MPLVVSMIFHYSREGGKYALVVSMILSTPEEVGVRGGGRGGGEKGYLFFQNFMVSKYLKNRDLMKKRIDVYMIYNFLIFMLLLLAWFFIICGKGEICSHCEHGSFEFQNCQHIFWIGDKITSHKNIISPFLIIIFMLLFVTMIFKFHEQKYSCSQC